MQARKRSAMRRIYCVFCTVTIIGLLAVAGNMPERASAYEKLLVSEIEFTSSKRISIDYAYPSTTAASSNSVESSTGTTALKTDPEQERRLVRAGEFAKRGRYDLAVVLWQAVLNESTDNVMTRDEWKYETSRHAYQKYRSMADEVERTLATLPKKGLDLYRLRADGEARALIAGSNAETRERALANVVRKYFISKHGDDAAFELACRKMDRGEFIGASRLFEKVLTEYPDSDIGKDEILRRLAVAQARVGDFEAAYKALAQLKKNPGDSRALIEMIEADLKSSATVTVEHSDSKTSWPIAMGSSARNGHMKAPSTLRKGTGLTELWSRNIDLGFAGKVSSAKPSGSGPSVPSTSTIRYGSGGFRSSIVTSSPYSSGYASPYNPYGRPISNVSTVTSDEELIARWKKNGWKPAGGVLIDGSRIYFKSRTQLVCLDTDTNRIVWKSLWENLYAPDAAYSAMAALNPSARRPKNVLDIQLFGDVIHHSMSMANGRVFSVEGRHPQSSKEEKPKPVATVTRSPYGYGYGVVPSFQRSRTNYLTAYDAKSGKLLWHRAAGVSTKEKSQEKVGFVGSPVPYASLLIAPVADNGEVWVYGLSQKTGKTLWKSKLCDEPTGGAATWSPTKISVDGGEVYVATGAGVVFALDGMTGSVRWAFRYPRTGRQNNYGGRYGRANIKMLVPMGLDEDLVIPYGRALVVMASDHDVIFAIDRRKGTFLWQTPVQLENEFPVNYCIGIYKNGMYLAGPKTIRRYDLRGGSLNWIKKLKTSDENDDASFGRAVVTDDGLYVPVKDSILKLSHKDGSELGQQGVVLAGNAPVGNLYSDGERMFVLNPNRLSALGDVKARMQALDKKVQTGDLTAHLERMRLRGRLRNHKGAIADLKLIIQRLEKKRPGKNDLRTVDVLLAAIDELRLPGVAPLETLRLLEKTRKVGGNAITMTEGKVINRTEIARNQQVRSALIAIRKDKPAGAVPVIMNAGPLYGTPHLQHAARMAVRDLATKDDVAGFRKSLDSKDLITRRLAVAGLSRIDAKPVTAALRSAIKDSDESLRLEAAVALCNRIDSEGLTVLADLLNSKDLQMRIRASRYLRKITGKRFQFVAYEKAESRAKAAKAWKNWVATNGKSASLTPVAEDALLLGRTLIANQSNNHVAEYGADRKLAKRVPVSAPSAVLGLPDGHRLVASSSHAKITEFDPNWKVVRTISTSSKGQPYSLRLLENGNILTAMYGSRRVVEYDRKGNVQWEAVVPGNASDAFRMSNGNTLVSLYGTYFGKSGRFSGRRSIRSTSGRLLEIDKSGKIVKQHDSSLQPWTASQLENGNLLVVQYSKRIVTEIDSKGRTVWQKSGLNGPLHAQRLPDGNTLIVHARGVSEYDPKGKEVWSKIGSNIRWVHRY